MWCFCGGGDKCFCHLKYVIYKLKCKKCFQTYIGKTKRELWIRIKEHLRAIKNGKGSALARHECRGDYDIRVLARAENNSQALGIMEGKMMNKYKPKINIKNEKRAREYAEKMGKLLRNKDSCKPDEKPRKNRDNDDFDDEFEYWIEESEFLSSEVEHEDENGDMSETEANKKIGGEERMSFNANNYVLLAAIEAHKNNKPFITLDLSSDEAKEIGICEPKQRSLLEKIWYSTPIGVWFDDEKTLKEKFLNLGINVLVTAVTVMIPIGTALTVAKLLVKTTACTAAYTIPGIAGPASTVCVMA